MDWIIDLTLIGGIMFLTLLDRIFLEICVVCMFSGLRNLDDEFWIDLLVIILYIFLLYFILDVQHRWNLKCHHCWGVLSLVWCFCTSILQNI